MPPLGLSLEQKKLNEGNITMLYLIYTFFIKFFLT